MKYKEKLDSFVSYLCGEKNSCGNKINWKSKERAQIVCTAMEKKRPDKKFEAYQCWYCSGGWHIGGALELTTWKFFRILWFYVKKKMR